MNDLPNYKFGRDDENPKNSFRATRNPQFYMVKKVAWLGKVSSSCINPRRESRKKISIQRKVKTLDTRINMDVKCAPTNHGNGDGGVCEQKKRIDSVSNIHEQYSIPSRNNRPYLLSNLIFSRLKIIITIGMLSANFPWRWNNKTKRIDRWSPIMVKLWKLYWYITVLQSSGMLFYHLRCFMGMYSRYLESYRGIFAYSAILYWYTCHLGYRVCMFLYEEELRKYINRLQDFNEEYSTKYLIYADKGTESGAGRMVMKLPIPAAASQIANSLFLFLITPSAPYYLTSNIKPLKWYALIPGALQDLTVTGHTIGTYLIISWLQVAHASSMEFWLREMHKDTKAKYTLDDLRNAKGVMGTYRVLQLMCSSFNDCMVLCIPVWKFSVAFGFIPGGFLWLRSMNKVFFEEFPGILLYPFGVINCFTMGFGCLAMAAKMYDNANNFIFSWSKTTKKDVKKLLSSFPALRMKVGKFYFITTATTITFFEILIHYVIDCIITFP